ncbi:MAG: class I SAM-dependent methyltransferase, partial [Burkholderiales bacterium]|nr:class I SAM-dependent methyltransferase [Burkholderiales bacterium]
MMVQPSDRADKPPEWDNASHPDFFEYYAQESLSERTLQRYTNIRDTVLRVLGNPRPGLRVADIGCGAGTQCRLWVDRGHRVWGVDVNEPLIQLARERAKETGVDVSFDVGSATKLPWPDRSMDVCLMPELLEHVADWQSCLNECARVLVPGGLVYLSTTNKLCPRQQ